MDTGRFITDMNSLFILKLKIFYLYIVDEVEKDLTHQIIKSTDHCLKERVKSFGIDKR